MGSPDAYERFRVEIGAVGPNQRSNFKINANLAEKLRIVQSALRPSTALRAMA